MNEIIPPKDMKNCLFSAICDQKLAVQLGCPFLLDKVMPDTKDLTVKCSTWNALQESAKERRERYAQEAKCRREVTRSEG